MTRVFWGVFAAAALANLAFILTGKKFAAAAAKVCLMPALAAVFAAGSGAPVSTVTAALFFAWLGDILLAGGGSGRRVLAGLVSFLICQTLYAVTFFRLVPAVNSTPLAVSASALAVCAVMFSAKEPGESNRLVRQPDWLPNKSRKTLRVLLFSAEVVRKLKFPNNSNACSLSRFFFPALVYGVTLALMTVSALRAAAGGFAGGIPLAAGALCFVLSDSLLAFFTIRGGGKSASAPARFSIMLFYIAAQGLIVAALLRGP